MKRTSYASGTPCWVDLGAPDPDAAAAFYAALFGWEITEPGPPETGAYRMGLLHGEPVVGIGTAQQPDVPPYWTTYVAVTDVDSTTKEVRDAGGQVLMEPMDVMDFGRMAVFADPGGAAFSVWQARSHPGAGMVNEPGSLCWNELQTRSPEECKAFYGTVFGWSPQVMEGSDYVEYQLGGSKIAGMVTMSDNFPPEVPPNWMIYFAVADVDATAAKVEELGGVIHVEPADIPPGRFAVAGDPQGAGFAFVALTNLGR